jgi:hypothetical protein
MMPEPTTIGTVGISAAIITVVGVLLRLVGPWRKQISEAEERLRKELMDQLAKERDDHHADLERERLARAAEARAFAMDRDQMGDRIAALELILKKRDKMREAERAIERHRFANLDGCFTAFLMLVKANPDKVAEAIEMVETMRANQLIAEAEEKAIFRAAQITAQGDDDDDD